MQGQYHAAKSRSLGCFTFKGPPKTGSTSARGFLLSDLLANRRVPCIAAPKLALVEPDFDPSGSQACADPLRGVGVFGGVAEKDGPVTDPACRVATEPWFVWQGALSAELIFGELRMDQALQPRKHCPCRVDHLAARFVAGKCALLVFAATRIARIATVATTRTTLVGNR